MPSLPASVLSLPPATRALTALLLSCTVLLFLLRISLAPRDLNAIFSASNVRTLAFPWLVLLPGSVLWYPWTLLTSAFVESNAIEFLISIFTLPLAGRYLERVWGQAEFLKFVLVVVVASNVIAVVVNVLEGMVLGNVDFFLYGMSYHGLMGLQVGFLVAFTQLIPEHQVQIFGGLTKIRVKSLPMLYVTVSNVACFLGFQSPYILIQFGWLASWFYLRFVKWNEGGEFRGDRSETFSFSGWFPPFAQKHIAKVSSHVFKLALRLRLLKPWTDIEQGSGASSSGTYTSVPGGARAEAERRRAMALKALDQRMASKPSTPNVGPSASGASASVTMSPSMSNRTASFGSGSAPSAPAISMSIGSEPLAATATAAKIADESHEMERKE